MLKIAVATSNGVTIDVHFGQATSFHIFDVAEDGSYALVEQRGIFPRSQGVSEGGNHADVTIEQLADVDVVLVNRIGPGPTRNLERIFPPGELISVQYNCYLVVIYPCCVVTKNYDIIAKYT